jgi:transcriptional regulator with XRE-family HTH domain
MGTNFNKLWNDPNFIDPSQKAKIDFEVALIGKLIEARVSKGLSQKELADLSGLKQPAIARLESMKATPQIDTLFRILQPLGYTLAVVPSDQPGSYPAQRQLSRTPKIQTQEGKKDRSQL